MRVYTVHQQVCATRTLSAPVKNGLKLREHVKAWLNKALGLFVMKSWGPCPICYFQTFSNHSYSSFFKRQYFVSVFHIESTSLSK